MTPVQSKIIFCIKKVLEFKKIGETGLEPAASASQKQRSSHLNYSPNIYLGIIQKKNEKDKTKRGD
jgi:hypothetical protein